MFTPIYSLTNVIGAGIWLMGTLLCVALYVGLLLCMRCNRTRHGLLRMLLWGAAALSLCDAAWWFMFYPGGEYTNPGIGGAAMLLLLPMLLGIVGCMVTVWNWNTLQKTNTLRNFPTKE